ncbi:hypothetical protein V1478_009577 [Vespula squamosa]|uniref:Uncharacterized protein n=1 Tax=Vespula squamosa TaxID=30214 RepID=A0ABD2AQ18_VESSQ
MKEHHLTPPISAKPRICKVFAIAKSAGSSQIYYCTQVWLEETANIGTIVFSSIDFSIEMRDDY